jgi:HK97 family phage portal protein
MTPTRLTPSEVRQARAAGYLTGPNAQKSSFFGGMFSFFSSFRFGGAGFLPAGADAKPPINEAASNTGQRVSPSSALTLAAVWACVWLNARTMASMPLNLNRYQAGGKGGGKPEIMDPLFTVLRWQPNAMSEALPFWTSMWASEQLWGTGYAEKIRNGGKVVALNFLLPQWMTPFLTDSGELRYRYDEPRRPREFAAADIFRIFTRTLDGLTGASVIEYGRHSLGLAQSGELAASKTFKRGLNASGFVTTEQFLKEAQRETFRESIEEFSGDGPNAGGTMVLEGKTDYKQLSMKPLDAELLSSRQFSVEDVCRWFGTPPILIGHASQGQTMWGSGIEQIFAGWLRLGLRPYIVGAQQSIRSQLIAPKDRLELIAEYDLDDLLAPDSQARANLYATLSQNGIATRNELRDREGTPAMPGGDVLTVQSNLIPLDQLGKGDPNGAGTPAAEKFRNALVEFLALDQGTAKKGDTREG